MWKDDENIWQHLFCGNTKAEIYDKGWSHLSFIKAWTSLTTINILIFGIINLLIFEEFIWVNIWVCCLIIWNSIMMNCHRDARSVFIFVVWVVVTLTWLQYHNTVKNYTDNWFGSNFLTPCDKSACTIDRTSTTVPYHPSGYFTKSIPTIDHLHIQCPVYDCLWAPPENFNLVTIQFYFNNGKNLPDYSRPCNTSTCDFIPSGKPEDYSHLGVGAKNQQLSICNNPNNIPACAETSYPRQGKPILTRCTAYFAKRNKLMNNESIACGEEDDISCMFCPGGLRAKALTVYELKILTIIQFTLFIIMSINLLIVLLNLLLKVLQNNTRFCQRRKPPPFFIPYNEKNENDGKPVYSYSSS